MELKELTKKYKGRKLSESELSSYEQWSLQFFHQKEFVQEPMLQMTLQLDITEAYARYQARSKEIPEASFSAYLIWHNIQAQKNHPYFRYRKIEDEWYIFDNLPIFFPVAVGGEARFSEVVIDNPAEDTLEMFFASYRRHVEASKNRKEFKALPPLVWANLHFIGNLPNLQFTGLQIHTPAEKCGRPYFYFGKRYKSEGRMKIPMLIAFDHSNLDPFVISAFMEEFEHRIKC
ncbi:MAG: CatA-like O-acetyltransferase [Cytophagales bacterium]|nr:CatA-like O-acetyltransferase [Cytophagales bacterium]